MNSPPPTFFRPLSYSSLRFPSTLMNSTISACRLQKNIHHFKFQVNTFLLFTHFLLQFPFILFSYIHTYVHLNSYTKCMHDGNWWLVKSPFFLSKWESYHRYLCMCMYVRTLPQYLLDLHRVYITCAYNQILIIYIWYALYLKMKLVTYLSTPVTVRHHPSNSLQLKRNQSLWSGPSKIFKSGVQFHNPRTCS